MGDLFSTGGRDVEFVAWKISVRAGGKVCLSAPLGFANCGY